MNQKCGIEVIAEERMRQVVEERYSYAHDDEHIGGQLATAAACYAIPAAVRNVWFLARLWPWEEKWWKPSPADRVKELAKAGALIAAEIDRITRAKG